MLKTWTTPKRMDAGDQEVDRLIRKQKPADLKKQNAERKPGSIDSGTHSESEAKTKAAAAKIRIINAETGRQKRFAVKDLYPNTGEAQKAKYPETIQQRMAEMEDLKNRKQIRKGGK